MRRKKPIQDRAKFTSDAILEAAEIIVLEEGYEKATTNYIAEKAGVSIGSLYQYFPNKNSIISALIEQTVSRVANGMRVVLREAMELPLEIASRNAFSYLLDNLREKKELFYSLPKRSPELIELTQNLSVEKFTHQTNRVLLEQHQDEMVPMDLEKALIVLEIGILANMRRYIMENPAGMTDEEFIDSMVRLSTAYLKYDLPDVPKVAAEVQP
ncbi:TetR family transcriptional regulator [Croceicoccus estronivorus]|uniref:TetR/AcrR family transcriptional regulator n=1 Tax=Croceicoccus estronivorus TaxID=1172626 RepID=UPI00082A9577|nr:TetR/AcrR family transcriptional regulator [Croceicoccus estronivorus]OCC25602.1 TetR family transcriptional regulator [Croceicoccus estronivorus]